MPRIIKNNKYVVLHTCGTTEDVSFQKGLWGPDGQKARYENLKSICSEAGVEIENNLATVGFNQEENYVRFVDGPDSKIFEKTFGNAIITSSKTALMAWAADCCLVALADEEGRYVSVLHASVNSLKKGIIRRAFEALADKSVKNVKAFVGACAGSTCYEYGKEKAADDFKDYPDCILPHSDEDKVFLDLHKAVAEELGRSGAAVGAEVEVVDFFADDERCSISAKGADGEFLFPSFRRDVDGNGRHINGNYGIVICRL